MNPFIEFISELVETMEKLSESLQILQQHMIIDEEEIRFYQKEKAQ